MSASSVMACRSTTLVELLQSRAAQQPHQIAYTHLLDDENSDFDVTVAELDLRSRAIAAQLQSKFKAGERALLLFPTGPHYIAAYFACLYAGIIAVPVFPPSAKRGSRNQQRLLAIARDARPMVALSTSSYLEKRKYIFSDSNELNSLELIAVDQIPDESATIWRPPSIDGENIAFLQYTSGSIGDPKGVMVSHRNILENERMIQAACGHTSRSDFVGWLPLYHDMGLIGNVLQPLYLGSRSILISPTAFLEKPYRWLDAISRYRAETSGGPNFAYELCIQKITPEERLKLDLSTWKIAFNGAEPVHHETMARFAEAFKASGFRIESFFPCYGLAESTLMVTGNRNRIPPGHRELGGKSLRRHLIEYSRRDDGDTVSIVSCGTPVADTELRIVDPLRLEPAAPDQLGEVWVASPAIARGYWGRPDTTEEIFGARLAGSDRRFLRTGDLGFMAEGELFIASRLKELIIIRGQNYHPSDIEWTASKCGTPLKLGSAAAFCVERDNQERLVLVQETQRADTATLAALCEAIRATVAEVHQANVYAVLLTRLGMVPKTSSGKIQRLACKDQFLEGTLELLASSIVEHTGAEAQQEGVPAPDLAELAVLPQDRAVELISEFLRGEIASIFHIPQHRISLQDPQLSQLGLDSLSAIELKSSIASKLHVVLPLASLLEGGSIRDVAAAIYEKSGQASWQTPAVSSAVTSEQPLSRMQQALWYLQQVAPGNSAYNLWCAFRIKNQANVPVLKNCLSEIVRRHPALRCTYNAASHLVQPPGAFGLVEKTVEACDSVAFLDRLREEINRPIDLAAGPVFRALLFTSASFEQVLLLVAHHITADLWSFGIILRDLEELYEAGMKGTFASLPESASQPGDYGRWEENMLCGDRGAELCRYWSTQLSGNLPSLDFMLDLPRPALQSFKGAEHHFRIELAVLEKLRTVCREYNVTLYTLLLASYQILLHKYTHQTDVLVGSTMAMRDQPLFSESVGNYTNTLVLRGKPAGNRSLSEYVLEMRNTVAHALNHGEYPFPKLVEILQPMRDMSRHPLFQAQFTLQRASRAHFKGLEQTALGNEAIRLTLGGLELESLPLDPGVSRFDLMLMVAETDAGLAALLNFDTSLFLPLTISRLAEHWNNLLTCIAEDCARTISDCSPLSSRERRELLVIAQGREVQPERELCVHDLIDEQVLRTPDRLCVKFGRQELTFSELDKKSNQLAHYLRRLGVGTETPVVLCLERSLEMVIGIVGVLKAGGVYVPADPAYPAERLANVFEESQAAVILTQSKIQPHLPTHWAQTVLVDSDWRVIEYEPMDAVESGVCSSNLAYILYTSGSTGKPKGIMITHAAVCNHMLWFQREFFLDHQDRVLQKTTFSFDASIWEFYAPMIAGACLVMAPPEAPMYGLSLLNVVKDEHITILQVVPSVLKTMVEENRLKDCESLRLLFCGGEPLSQTVYRDFRSQSSATLVNLYGPTEATIDTTFWIATSDEAVSIGRSIDGVRVYALDDDANLVPTGAVGELYIGGAGLARGYLNQPDISAEKFMPDPFTIGARLYRTGDIVRLREDGNLQFIGRKDGQIKLLGYRIELQEIQSVLSKHPEVASCAVLLQENGQESKRIVAYVKSRTQGPFDGTAFQQHLRSKIPNYMIPSSYIQVDELPLTPNGKLDVQALQQLEGRQHLERPFVAPRTALETMLAECWGEVLGVERVGVEDNFFELGGHSLLAARLISTLQEVVSTSHPLLALFYENPTVSGFAAAILASNDSLVEPERAAEIFQYVKQLPDETITERLAGENPISITS